jgi:hypothetical protein
VNIDINRAETNARVFTDLCTAMRLQRVIVGKNIISTRAAVAAAIRSGNSEHGRETQAHRLTAVAAAVAGSTKKSAGFTSRPAPDFLARIAIFSSRIKH